MRVKKGFTLAEILIVLMVIGVIATMTIPSLMRGVTEQQWKTAFNKAYNTVANIATMSRVAGQLPATKSNASGYIFQQLSSNLAVREYATPATTEDASVKREAFYQAATYTGPTGDNVKVGPSDTAEGETATAAGGTTPWIISDDNLSYAVYTSSSSGGTSSGGATTDCGSKAEINSQDSISAAFSKACAVVLVDVNGIMSTPNIVEPQLKTGEGGKSTLSATSDMAPLIGDRYYIFIGNDGAALGKKSISVMARIAAGEK